MAPDRKVKDPFLNEKLKKYNQWLAAGKISFSSKVIPISQSLEACQYVLPTHLMALQAVRGCVSLRGAGVWAFPPCLWQAIRPPK